MGYFKQSLDKAQNPKPKESLSCLFSIALRLARLTVREWGADLVKISKTSMWKPALLADTARLEVHFGNNIREVE